MYSHIPILFEYRNTIIQKGKTKKMKKEKIPNKQKIFIKNMKILRIMSGLTQKELSIKMNRSQNSISNYESGKMCPDLNFLFSLCDIFNVDANEICGYSKCAKIDEFVSKTQKLEAELVSIENEQNALKKKKLETTKRLMRYQEEFAKQFSKTNIT